MPGRVRSIESLRRELRTKERQVRKLRAQRKKLAAGLEAIDRKIAALTSVTAVVVRRKRRKVAKKRTSRITRKVRAARPRRARKRSMGAPLVTYIKKVLAGSKGMRAKNVQAAVTKVGYRSSSKDFYNIVAAALRDKKLFKRVSRGVYKLAKAK